MKPRKILTLIILFISLVFISGCNIIVDENGISFNENDTPQIIDEPNTNDPTLDQTDNYTSNECQAPTESLFTEEQLMATRNLIRESNITITVNLYQKSFNRLVLAGTSLGSGVVYKKDLTSYYAITNYHVINSTNYYDAEYFITTHDGIEIEGSLVSYDSAIDIAVVKFAIKSEIPLIDINERQNQPLVKDEFLLAVGNPSGVQDVVTFGLYIGTATIQNANYPVLNHNVLIYHGNSGGALTDLFGNLVGINTWGDETNDENNFAIPLEKVISFLTDKSLL